MTKQEIVIKLVKVFTDIPTSKIEAILNQLVKIITETVKKKEPVKISGLGTFILKEIKERPGFNPQTRVKMIVPAYKAVKFRASETLKKAVRQ